ncbi:MAG: hypothetical protein ACRDQ5_05190 [Sciscionella sp.]
MASWQWPRRAAQRREVNDDETLTQFGMKGAGVESFRGQPRFDDGETELSMCVGHLRPEEILPLISGRQLRSTDAVRYFNVGKLRSVGYIVIHTPNAKNPLHVSVAAPQDVDAARWWKDMGEPALELYVESSAPCFEEEEKER